ncbi:thioredoxin-like protein [Lipomyces oligophaga]|uniref:thioredoxin-like protein n=1 Tax=Lipomyces oligophaga TaxID=45792 RepID=UPI0034CE3BD0
MDSTTSRIFDEFTDKLVAEPGRDEHDSADEDEFMELLEEDTTVLDAFRERRMQELAVQMKKARKLHEDGHGILTEVPSEKEVMNISTSTKHVVVHFFHPSFKRCAIMTARLQALTAKHMETRFININVDNAPFLVVRLGIKVLPCVVCFIDGIEKLRLVGFDKLGNQDDFSSEALEFTLQKCGVIQSKLGKLREHQSSTPAANDEDSDWD